MLIRGFVNMREIVIAEPFVELDQIFLGQQFSPTIKQELPTYIIQSSIGWLKDKSFLNLEKIKIIS